MIRRDARTTETRLWHIVGSGKTEMDDYWVLPWMGGYNVRGQDSVVMHAARQGQKRVAGA